MGAHTTDQLLEFSRISENLEIDDGVDAAVMNSIASVGSVCNTILVHENRQSVVLNKSGPPTEVLTEPRAKPNIVRIIEIMLERTWFAFFLKTRTSKYVFTNAARATPGGKN
jgi:hypothetical protein